MKFLTLNSHSWMEENAQQKFETLKEQILEAQYDVICFQEVNQEMGSEAVETDEYYQALPSSVAIHKDHFVRVLVEELAAQGLHYYWTWAYNHIGYDHLNEGVADYHTRRVAVAHTSVDGKEIAVASVHLSWWDKGFQFEWPRIENYFSQVGKPFILAGDFNNPAGQEGYETILSSSLKLQDSFIEAKETKGTYTVGPGIDGWTDNQVPLRIDYVFASPEWDIQRLHVIFDDQNKPHVSDHYGLEAELSL